MANVRRANVCYLLQTAGVVQETSLFWASSGLDRNARNRWRALHLELLRYTAATNNSLPTLQSLLGLSNLLIATLGN